MSHVYRLTDVPPAGDYVRGLAAIHSRMHESQLRLLQTHYRIPHRKATATQLAELAGIQGGRPVVNAHYGRLGHLLCDAIKFNPDVRPDGTFRWWAMWSQGYETPNGFVWEMLPEVSEALELLGWVAGAGPRLPEEVTFGQRFVEGAACRIVVNAYERNLKARLKCIEHYGPVCIVCGFDSSAVYGPLAEGLIHVHHVKPLSQIGEAYQVDPVDDLRPVCPNCHAVIHMGGGCLDIGEVQQLLNRRR